MPLTSGVVRLLLVPYDNPTKPTASPVGGVYQLTSDATSAMCDEDVAIDRLPSLNNPGCTRDSKEVERPSTNALPV